MLEKMKEVDGKMGGMEADDGAVSPLWVAACHSTSTSSCAMAILAPGGSRRPIPPRSRSRSASKWIELRSIHRPSAEDDGGPPWYNDLHWKLHLPAGRRASPLAAHMGSAIARSVRARVPRRSAEHGSGAAGMPSATSAALLQAERTRWKYLSIASWRRSSEPRRS